MKILIVDDEACIVELFSRLARAQGHEDIDSAGSTEEALGCTARDKAYDLITLDLNMPGANGLEIVALLRIANPHAVIALISGCLPGDIDSAVAGCIDTMISKPVSVDSFIQLLQSAAQRGESLRGIPLAHSAKSLLHSRRNPSPSSRPAAADLQRD